MPLYFYETRSGPRHSNHPPRATAGRGLAPFFRANKKGGQADQGLMHLILARRAPCAATAPRDNTKSFSHAIIDRGIARDLTRAK